MSVLGAKPPAAGGKGVLGQRPQPLKVFAIFTQKSNF